MRAIVAVFLVLHGFAHLVGFAVPWGFVPAAGNGAPAPPAFDRLFGGRVVLGATAFKVSGILWLLTGLLFAVVAIRWWRDDPRAVLALAGVSLVSLCLSIAWWPAARIGVWINLAILAIIMVLGTMAYRRDMKAAHTAARARSLMVSTRAGWMEYATAGAGAPVLVIHGTGGGWDQGLYAAARLTDYGFRLIAPSRFGYLRTPFPAKHSPADEADAFAALLDELSVQRVVVISFSAGTSPALQFALRHPDRVSALILMVPAAGGIMAPAAKGPPAFVMNVVLGSDLPMWLALRYSPRTVSGIAAVPYDLIRSLPSADQAHYQQGVEMLLPVTLRRAGMKNDARNQSGGEAVYPIAGIGAPMLLVSAEDDLYGTAKVARAAATRVPGAEALIVKTGGHFLLGQDAVVWPAVAQFIRTRATVPPPATPPIVTSGAR